jgi:hypothetical protein
VFCHCYITGLPETFLPVEYFDPALRGLVCLMNIDAGPSLFRDVTWHRSVDGFVFVFICVNVVTASNNELIQIYASIIESN